MSKFSLIMIKSDRKLNLGSNWNNKSLDLDQVKGYSKDRIE